VAKHAKVIIAVLVVVILSVLMALSEEPMFGAAVLVLGMLGIAVLREKQDGDTHEEPAPNPQDGKTKLDQAVESAAPRAETAPAPSAPSAGLPTWSPSTFDRTMPPEAPAAPAAPEPFAFRTPAEPAATPAPAAKPAWDTWREFDGGTVADEYDVQNPLADLDRLDEIDPIAEVERLEGLGSGAPRSAFSFSSAPTIDEQAVRTDDDIMAASQATELQVGEGADSELARLLAKVQARLAAYE
jgi:hypothetical protein